MYLFSGRLAVGCDGLGLNFGITRSGEFPRQLSESGAVLTVLATHSHSYLKLSPGYMPIAHLPATACIRFCGKYLQAPAAQAHNLFAHLNMAALTHSMTSTPAREVKLLGAVTVAGQLAWLLQDSHEVLIYVAAHGKPYILRPPPRRKWRGRCRKRPRNPAANPVSSGETADSRKNDRQSTGRIRPHGSYRPDGCLPPLRPQPTDSRPSSTATSRRRSLHRLLLRDRARGRVAPT
jgi:hypothetical protein